MQTAPENTLPEFGALFVAVALLCLLKLAIIAADRLRYGEDGGRAWVLGDIGVGLMAWLNIVAGSTR